MQASAINTSTCRCRQKRSFNAKQIWSNPTFWLGKTSNDHFDRVSLRFTPPHDFKSRKTQLNNFRPKRRKCHFCSGLRQNTCFSLESDFSRSGCSVNKTSVKSSFSLTLTHGACSSVCSEDYSSTLLGVFFLCSVGSYSVNIYRRISERTRMTGCVTWSVKMMKKDLRITDDTKNIISLKLCAAIKPFNTTSLHWKRLDRTGITRFAGNRRHLKSRSEL